MSITRSNENNPMFVFHPTIASTFTKDLVNQLNTSWHAFMQLETSKHLAADLKEHFNELNHIIDDINTTSNQDQCAKSLEALFNKIKSMANQHQFILTEELDSLTRIGAQNVITNLVINLFENITELQRLLNKHPEIPHDEKEEKTRTPESRRISQSLSEKTSPILSEEEKEVPGGVMNIMLDYDSLDKVSNENPSVPLVPTFFKFKTERVTRLKPLLEAIVSGNLDKVTAIIEKEPSLLEERLEAKDYVTAPSGQRSNNATAYRTALAVEDTQMAAMIRAKLIEIAGKDAADTQYHEQFPDGWEAAEEKRSAPLFTQLNTLTDVIKDAKQGDITSSGDPEYKLTVREGSSVATALAQFRSLLDEKLNDIVTTGRHFNPKLLLQALKIYDDRYKDFGCHWSDPRAMIFWQQVIGTVQRGLPVNYVQAFCDGLYTTEEKLRDNNPQGRSLKFQLFDTGQGAWVSSDFYPLSVSRLGFDYAIYGLGQIGVQLGCRRLSGLPFLMLCQSKTDTYRHLHPSSKTLAPLVSGKWINNEIC